MNTQKHKAMYIYKISQNVHNSYDTYDSAVVAAESEEDARNIHPSGHMVTHVKDGKWMGTRAEKVGGGEYEYKDCGSWIDYSQIHLITVELIGTAVEGVKRGVIVASFNAG